MTEFRTSRVPTDQVALLEASQLLLPISELSDTMTATMSSAETGQLPYVVSADGNGLMRKWERRHGHFFKAPSEQFFSDLAVDLHSYISEITGHKVEIVNQQELHQGMEELVIGTEVPVISLDRAYFSDSDEHIAAHIDATRAVDPDFNDLGLRPRPEAEPLDIQLDQVAQRIEPTEIALVDDVIFTATGALEIIDHLKSRGKDVVRVIAGIVIGGGKQELEKQGVEVVSVKTYPAVVDEVCERDFLAGIPMSGRTVYDSDGNWWSAPYFAPFGNAEKWASIPPENLSEFASFCLRQTIELWSATEEASGKIVSVSELPRPLRLGDAEPGESVVSALGKLLNNSELMVRR